MVAQLEETIDALKADGTLLIFTDGSIDQTTGRADAAGVTDGASLHNKLNFMQSRWRLSTLLILNTPLSTSSQTLFQPCRHFKEIKPTDNIRVVMTIFLIPQLEQQHRSLTFWWIPSYLNISGNYSADAAAKDNLRYPSATGHIPPSLTQLKRQVRKTSYEVLLIEYRIWASAGSPSAKWYQTVNNYDPSFSITTLTKHAAAILHRLRLGYICNREIESRLPKQYHLCDQVTEEPLIHSILDCPSIQQFRPQHYHSPDHRDRCQYTPITAKCLIDIVNIPNALVLTKATPPR